MPGSLRLECQDATLSGWVAWLCRLAWLAWLARLDLLAGLAQLAWLDGRSAEFLPHQPCPMPRSGYFRGMHSLNFSKSSHLLAHRQKAQTLKLNIF